MQQPPTPNANSRLFQSFYKDVWRKLIPDGLTEAETDFIEEVGRLKAGSRVLDLMCGYGRHTLALAKRGYAVTAVDNLPDYIEEIGETARREALSVEPVLADVVEAAFQGPYDAALCMGNSFASFDAENTAALLHKLAACLQPGGVFIINTWMLAEIAIKHFEEKTWLYVDEFKYLLDNRYRLQPSRIETDHILIAPDGQTQVLKGVDYIFSFAELQQLLEQAGLSIRAVYSTPRKRPYVFGDKRAYIVAGK
ncbi:class I SAM-dependent methyltransferase [Paraflavisolibacter sp. H34]|uniref:SAM-dependent methyltransferase n=1 Tax=Huijunlia imazamoxiresistens TaxID=3127457 RepID=UPI003015E936